MFCEVWTVLKILPLTGFGDLIFNSHNYENISTTTQYWNNESYFGVAFLPKPTQFNVMETICACYDVGLITLK